jgi:cation-transporting P-type ATPase 13A2
MLTGESQPCLKTPIVLNENKYDPYNEGKAHTLFSGTKIVQIKENVSDISPSAIGFVSNVGFYTARGKLIKSILFTESQNFKFFRDSLYFVLFLLCLGLLGKKKFNIIIYSILKYEIFLGSIFSTVSFIKRGTSFFGILIHSIDIITIALPPALPICLSVGTSIAMERSKEF